MNLEQLTTQRLNQTKTILDEKCFHLVDIESLLEEHYKLLQRLRCAERFCIAAKALAEYNKPLASVLNSLDAWEKVTWGSQLKQEIENEKNLSLDNRGITTD